MIKISEVTKRYGTINALDAISLEIKEGVITGLLGVNGAGKTTLLSILNGLIECDSGEISIFGLDIHKDKRAIKSISSIIPQHLAFYEKLSVKENLDFFSTVQNATKKNYENAIEINALGELLNQKTSTLSGGQKRRLNIAIGLLNNPKVLYFDEPTVGIDPKSRNEILDSIKSYKELGITVVYTSHYMGEVERICDEVAIIDKGRLVAHDNLDNLLSNRSSNKVLIEVVCNEKLKRMGLNLMEEYLIETTEAMLCDLLEKLKEEAIGIKQIRYGTTNLEKYFLEATGTHRV